MLPPKRYDPIKAGIRERIRKEKFVEWQRRSAELERETKEALAVLRQMIKKGNEDENKS